MGWANNPTSNFLSQSASQEAIIVAIYSAYVELCATNACFLHIRDIIAKPKLKQHPQVLFLSVTLPAQSESVSPSQLSHTWTQG
jgi:hypothetical protein